MAYWVDVDLTCDLNISSGCWGNLMVAGEPPEMLWSLLLHSIERRETLWIELLSINELTKDFGEQDKKDNDSIVGQNFFFLCTESLLNKPGL